MYFLKDFDITAKAKYELGFILFNGILEEIEKGNLDKGTIENMILFYKKYCCISAYYLEEKFNAKYS